MMSRLSKWVFLFLLIFLIPFLAAAAININEADLAELKTLQGIGDVKAQAIIDYRETNGLFKTIEEIKNVSGIGEVTFTNIKDQITITNVENNIEASKQIDDNEAVATTTTDSSSVAKSGSSLSSHSRQVIVNFFEPEEVEFAVTAGRKRLGVVNQPINFEAEIIQGKTTSRGGDFDWTFGDGGSAGGRSVTYTYQTPGTYQVVLNAEFGGQVSVSRTEVVVVEPKLSISRSLEYDAFLITNSDQYEINVGNWIVKAGDKEFRMPEDTIVAGKQAILLADNISGLGANQAIIYPGYYNTNTKKQEPQEDFEMDSLAPALSEGEMKQLAVVLADSLVKVRQMERQIKTQVGGNNKPSPRLNNQLSKPSINTSSSSLAELSTPSNNLAGVVVLGRDDGILQKITDWPVSSWHFLKQVFLD